MKVTDGADATANPSTSSADVSPSSTKAEKDASTLNKAINNLHNNNNNGMRNETSCSSSSSSTSGEDHETDVTSSSLQNGMVMNGSASINSRSDSPILSPDVCGEDGDGGGKHGLENGSGSDRDAKSSCTNGTSTNRSKKGKGSSNKSSSTPPSSLPPESSMSSSTSSSPNNTATNSANNDSSSPTAAQPDSQDDKDGGEPSSSKEDGGPSVVAEDVYYVHDSGLTIKIIAPGAEPFEIQVSSTEIVQELHQLLMEREDTCHRTCFSLQLDGNTLDNFAELKSVPGLKDGSVIKVVEEPYTCREARIHVKHVRDLLKPSDWADAYAGTDCASLSFLNAVSGGELSGKKRVVDCTPPDYIMPGNGGSVTINPLLLSPLHPLNKDQKPISCLKVSLHNKFGLHTF